MMGLIKHVQRQKIGVHPHRIIFEKENTENTYISWEDKMKPRIDLDDGITQEEYQTLAARWEEILSLAEEIIWQNYLNPKSDDLMSEVDSFPDIRYLTGHYYVGDVSYGYIYRDKKYRAYHIKEGCGTSITTEKSGWRNGSPWTARKLPDITRFFSPSVLPVTRAVRRRITWGWTWKRNLWS